ncbi:sugar fermentation stimulation protein [Candidatus Vecturithrix granuli]|uniref:Sugar fermentation stimulation protein n=1 Tax=Vecturithrix granuli TaxID=1499967 RepID=A0A081C7H3_VECG1|nr:sugar fermentation stimulation protein [Candidatus Vecturithrix granuli]
MSILTCYKTYERAFFLERPNRFVMTLETGSGDIIQTHVPNPGRMEEFCTDHHPFFIVPVKHGKYAYRVVATTYQNQFVFLDTLKVNDIFAHLLAENCVPQFLEAMQIQREVTVGDSRFDFRFVHEQQNVIVEIKSCTLCHNGLAMFPDAPTLRGQKHLNALDRLAREKQAKTYIIFLILNASAERFMPDIHADLDYAKLFLAAQYVTCQAFKLNVIDPVSIDLASLQSVPIDEATTRTHCHNKGAYLVVLENSQDVMLTIGKLGQIHFPQGWYVYVGSAMNSLDARLKRHQRTRKKRFWHIDYLASTMMKVRKVYPIRSADRIEARLAHAIGAISDEAISHFGASDAHENSHLFYFNTLPFRQRAFIDVVFNAWTFSFAE